MASGPSTKPFVQPFPDAVRAMRSGWQRNTASRSSTSNASRLPRGGCLREILAQRGESALLDDAALRADRRKRGRMPHSTAAAKSHCCEGNDAGLTWSFCGGAADESYASRTGRSTQIGSVALGETSRGRYSISFLRNVDSRRRRRVLRRPV